MLTRPLLAFWSFASGWMLLWGLAASIPIIIHLWSKRRYREESWAAMEFLLAALRNNARRIRIEQFVLLLIRTAVLLLLALALADPLFSFVSGMTGNVGGGRTHWVLVVDGSYSMDRRVNGKGRFDQARELARRVVRESTQGDGFTLMLMADTPTVIVSTPAYDPDDMEDEIDGLRLRHGGANLSSALAEVETLIRDAERKQPRLNQHRVCFFTDLGRNTWDEVSTEPCRRRLRSLEQQSTLLVYDVGEPTRGNLAVADLAVRESVVTSGREVSISARIANSGDVDQSERRILLLVDDRRVAEQPLKVEAGGEATVPFRYRFESPGEHRIEARLDDDSLAVDNHRWLSVPVREAVPVLCVSGKPESARYVALALDPGSSEPGDVRVVVEPESAILESNLNRFACVFLCNVARIGADEAGVLRDYVEAGGGLVVCLGDRVQAENYNAELADPGGSRCLLPARLGEPAPHAGYFFDPLDYDHDIVAPFRGFERSGLITTPVWRYVRLEPIESMHPRTALALDNGDPAIVECAVGRGRCVLVATAMSNASFDRSVEPPVPWTAIATWPSFPPLVQEILHFAIQGSAKSRNVDVGEPIMGVVPDDALSLPLVIAVPDASGGSEERISVTNQGGQVDWTFDQTWWSGVYEARFGSPATLTRYYAANPDTGESDPARFDVELLPSQIVLASQADAPDSAVIPSTRNSRYFRLFLAGMLVLLVVETVYAWHIGGART